MDRLDERITPELWDRIEKETREEQTSIQDQLTRLKSDEAKYFEVWLNILDLAMRAREIYIRRSPEQRRVLLSHIFSNLVLKDQKVTYTLTKPVEKLAERVQQRLDAENIFEPQKSKVNKRQKDSFESLCPALLPLLSEFRTLDWKGIQQEMQMSGLLQLDVMQRVALAT